MVVWCNLKIAQQKLRCRRERRHEKNQPYPKFNRMNSNWREMLYVYVILCSFLSNYPLTFQLCKRKPSVATPVAPVDGGCCCCCHFYFISLTPHSHRLHRRCRCRRRHFPHATNVVLVYAIFYRMMLCWVECVHATHITWFRMWNCLAFCVQCRFYFRHSYFI